MMQTIDDYKQVIKEIRALVYKAHQYCMEHSDMEFHDELKQADDALQDIAKIAEQKISDIKKYKNETYSADAVVEYSERILDIVRKATNKKEQTNEK